jgi:tetratricopeptide (TPR) repeat protein
MWGRAAVLLIFRSALSSLVQRRCNFFYDPRLAKSSIRHFRVPAARMGKTRPPERSKLARRNKSSKAKSRTPHPSPSELLSQAILHLHQSDIEEALSLATQALKILKDAIKEDDDVISCLPALNLLGEINVEFGEIETARRHFNQAASIDEDGDIDEKKGGGPDKFLWLAQLSEEGGRDSVRWYTKAVDALRRRVDALIDDVSGKDNEDEIEETKGKLANALCAVAEVYMTDLSWEEDAEERCEEATREALEYQPRSVETLQTVASVRISQGKIEEARTFLERSLSVWKDEPVDSLRIPEFAVRISLVRLLLEAEMLDEALIVLERLVAEDDQSVETWYLGGWCLHLLAEKQEEAEQIDTYKRSRRWLRQCLRLYDLYEYEDERLQEHAKELVVELDKALVDEADEDDGEAGAEDWESVEGDDDQDEDEEEDDDVMEQ